MSRLQKPSEEGKGGSGFESALDEAMVQIIRDTGPRLANKEFYWNLNFFHGISRADARRSIGRLVTVGRIMASPEYGDIYLQAVEPDTTCPAM